MVLLILEYFTQKVNRKISKFCVFKKGGDFLLYDKVKAVCKQQGVTIMKLESDLGFPRSSICKWNENEPGVNKVKKVADYLKIDINQLIS